MANIKLPKKVFYIINIRTKLFLARVGWGPVPTRHDYCYCQLIKTSLMGRPSKCGRMFLLFWEGPQGKGPPVGSIALQTRGVLSASITTFSARETEAPTLLGPACLMKGQLRGISALFCKHLGFFNELSINN